MTTKSKVPQIRFKGFSGEWETKELGDIGSVVMNKRIFKSQTTEKGDIPFYKIGTFGGKADAFISRQLFEDYKSKYPYPKKGDLLISASGSIGRIVEYAGKDEYFQDSNIVWLRHENQLENSFLKQFYKIVKWNGLEGSTIQRLYNKNILETQISFPVEKNEQTKIGDYFQQLDKLIEQKEKKYEKLKQFKKASLVKMFPKNGADTPEIRFKGFSGEWEEKKLGDIATFTKGKGISKADVIDNGQMLCVRYGELYTAYNEVITTIYSRTNSNIDMVYSQENDILMPTSDVTPRGLATASALSQSGIILGGDILIIRSEEIVNSFFSYFVSGHKNKIIKLVSGTTVFHLYAKDIENLYLHLPSKEEQIKIGNYFQKLDTQIELQLQEIEKLKNIKKASLAKMFV